MRVAVTRGIPEAGLELLRREGDVVVWPEPCPPSREQLIEFAAGADGLLTLLTERIDGELLDALPSVRAVSNMAVGYDNIDVEAATARGVVVCITPDVLTETTADFAFALILAVARKVKPAADSVLRGEWRTWEPMGFLGQDVHGATLGVVGMGRIGQAVARRARGFNMKILYSDQQRRPEIEEDLGARFASLDQLLRESDIVTLHVPLTRETRKLIGAEQLRSMKRSAILINTARGGVVDTEALADALESGTIWAAGLDVTDPEPLPADHRLLRLPNVLVTPHIASASEATRAQMSRLAAENLIAALRGEEPPRSLNWEAVRGLAQS
ncbi:D-glycerate dehydrogenase [Thermomicrobiaceae bacterium CFH 74404]|uniref:D-glycerate dehydrogenase n=1 Tax=Thermalbibacter longus TaxID=2951981 RepID=A0AA42BAZ0_9BACT|nr:D-glycerate dehydrogenase [Thermalbibacter longus]MCM8750376.1 D-glycerate dehydrogenase [Thermalbibacter longus]